MDVKQQQLNKCMSSDFLSGVKGEFSLFLNLDLISGMKYVHLLTENSLVKVGVLRKIFRFLEIHITE